VYDINSDLSILKSDFSDKKLLIAKARETVLKYSHGRLKQQSRLYSRKKRRTQRRKAFSTVCCYKTPLVQEALKQININPPAMDFYKDMKDFLKMRLAWKE